MQSHDGSDHLQVSYFLPRCLSSIIAAYTTRESSMFWSRLHVAALYFSLYGSIGGVSIGAIRTVSSP